MTFVELLQQFGVPYKSEGKHCRPGWVQVDCPQCRGSLYLGYNLHHKYMNCWRCGPLPLVGTLLDLLGQPYTVVKGLLGSLEGEVPSQPLPQRGKLVKPGQIGPLKQAHRAYLRERGFDPLEVGRLWGVQGTGVAAELGWRLFIPIHLNGQVVSWTTRALTDKTEARYVSAKADQEIFNHKELLYGEDYVRNAIIVHEGPLDVWRTGPGAVATFGTTFSRAQVFRIAQYPVRAICFDNEPEARKRANELCNLLEGFSGDTYKVTLDSKDAGEATRKEIKRLRDKFLR